MKQLTGVYCEEFIPPDNSVYRYFSKTYMKYTSNLYKSYLRVESLVFKKYHL